MLGGTWLAPSFAQLRNMSLVHLHLLKAMWVARSLRWRFATDTMIMDVCRAQHASKSADVGPKRGSNNLLLRLLLLSAKPRSH